MNNPGIYQLILGLISLLLIVAQLLKFTRRESNQTFFKFITFEIIWVSIFALTLFPGLSRQISQTLGFGENLNTLIFIGFVIVFVIIFKLLSIIEKMEQNISEIVRKEALEQLTPRKGDNGKNI